MKPLVRVIVKDRIKRDIRPEVSVAWSKSRLVDYGTILELNSSVNKSVE